MVYTICEPGFLESARARFTNWFCHFLNDYLVYLEFLLLLCFAEILIRQLIDFMFAATQKLNCSYLL